MKYHTKSYEETQGVGEVFAKELKGGDVLFLFGDLGAGKTTFMQGLAKGLNVSHRIISPTFIIMRTYDASLGDITKLYHLDLYRTASQKDIEGLGFDEILKDTNGVVAIEWPEKLQDNLPRNYWSIHFTTKNEDERIITIEKN